MKTNKEKIYNLELHNPIIHAWLTHHRYTHGVSYQAALEGMVLSLVESNSALQAQLCDCISRKPQEIVWKEK